MKSDFFELPIGEGYPKDKSIGLPLEKAREQVDASEIASLESQINDREKWIRGLESRIAELTKPKTCEDCIFCCTSRCPVELFSEPALHFEKHPFWCNRYKPKEPL